tara:strand:- start:3776 stop:4060 length:285 start_codon:yes stop_codon:yes gene_type:complete
VTIIKIGDMVRWRNSLFLVENGIEHDVGQWHHALVVEVNTRLTKTLDTITSDLLLLMIGREHNSNYLPISYQMFIEIGNVEKLVERKWVAVTVF